MIKLLFNYLRLFLLVLLRVNLPMFLLCSVLLSARCIFVRKEGGIKRIAHFLFLFVS